MGGDSEMSSIPKGYKKTELGVIPEDWDEKKLGDICEKIIGGGTPSRNNKIYWNGKIPWATVKDLSSFNANSTQEYITEEGLRESSSTLVPAGTIILATRMLIGQPVIYHCNVAINQDLKALFLSNGYNKYFLSYVLNDKSKELVSSSSGSTVLGLSVQDLRTLNLILPPLHEQETIAEVLSDMDALIEAQKELIAKKRDIKQGAMQDLLSGRVRLPGYESKGWKHTDIGDIPNDWEVKKLGEEGVFLTTSSYTRSELKEYGDVACIHYGDIHTRFHTWLDCSSTELPMISKDMVKQYPYLKNGDLVIADASEDYEGLGDCVEICNIDSRLCIGGLHTIVYRAKPGLFAPSYIGLLRNLQVVRNQLVSQAVGTKVYSLTNSMIGSILVLVPSLLSEQQTIAEVLSDMDNEIETLEAELEKLHHMKRGMMQELLTGSIRLI